MTSSLGKEYGVTLEQVERSYKKVLVEIKQERGAGKLKPWILKKRNREG